MNDIRDVLAKNLKRLRAQKNINQEMLAEAIGVSKETIAKTETRQNWLGAENLNKIIEFFAVAPEELFRSGGNGAPAFRQNMESIKAELKRELQLYIDEQFIRLRQNP